MHACYLSIYLSIDKFPIGTCTAQPIQTPNSHRSRPASWAGTRPQSRPARLGARAVRSHRTPPAAAAALPAACTPTPLAMAAALSAATSAGVGHGARPVYQWEGRPVSQTISIVAGMDPALHVLSWQPPFPVWPASDLLHVHGAAPRPFRPSRRAATGRSYQASRAWTRCLDGGVECVPWGWNESIEPRGARLHVLPRLPLSPLSLAPAWAPAPSTQGDHLHPLTSHHEDERVYKEERV